ncbi:MAG: PHP domain-containing protein, partial [Candidatus Hodarchaeota archaeon]
MIDLHIHTTYSDGQASIPEVFKIATSKKLDYIAISDHYTTSS